ncbi:MAG: hypothetical protein IRZ16_01160 [Myxococcaceae bacterium]|nr:hypothetical protein [Myxococcaceae bacterium]
MQSKILDERASRHIPVARDEVLQYIDGELRNRNAEWEAVLGLHGSEQGKWGRALKEWRNRAR